MLGRLWNESISDIVLFRIGEKNAIEAILINMDSNLIKKQINKKGVSVEAVSKMYFSHIYAHSLMIYSSLLGYYSDEKNAYDLDKGAIEVLKEGLGNAIETVFQYYGGFLMEFGTDNDFLE